MRYTEYHAGVPIIKDRKMLPGSNEEIGSFRR